MKHEYTAILNHLRVKHNMTLTEYTETHMKQGEEGDEVTDDNIAEEEETEVGEDNVEGADINDDQFYVVSTEAS